VRDLLEVRELLLRDNNKSINMGLDCDIHGGSSRGTGRCHNRITHLPRFYLRLPEKYNEIDLDNYDDYDRPLLTRHFSCINEGICTECFLQFVVVYDDKDGDVDFDSELVNYVQTFYPDINENEIDWYMEIHDNTIEKKDALAFIKKYTELRDEDTDTFFDNQLYCKLIDDMFPNV